MLVFFIYLEEGEDKDENENIINTQGVFNNITCKEFQGFGSAHIKIDDCHKDHGKRYPDNCPDNRLFNRDPMQLPVKNSQIESQHDQNKNIKACPE